MAERGVLLTASLLLLIAHLTSAASLGDLLVPRALRLANINWARKRKGDTGQCEPWKPFQCPEGTCIPIKYLCDGSQDCDSFYDEDVKMCTAAKRPPVEETENFLKALMSAHGDDFFAGIFGVKAKGGFSGFGGIAPFAVALSESPTAEDFGQVMGMSGDETEHMKDVLFKIAEGDLDGLDFTGAEASDLRFYIDKLIETGFVA